MEEEQKERDLSDLWFTIITFAIIVVLGLSLLAFVIYTDDLKKQINFNYIREGTCISYDNDDDFIFVYDEETNDTLKVNVNHDLVYTDIAYGDTILYLVDYDMTYLNMLNVIKKEK